MSKVKSILMVAVAVTGATLASSCFGQGCQTCQSSNQVFGFAPPVHQSVPMAATCNGSCGGGQVYAGSTGGCGAAGCKGGQFFSELQARKAHARMIHDRTMARNGAWPKPFDCADRQLYFQIWEPMIDQGFEEQCVLTSAHFNAETNQLNKFGQHAVAGIMQNMPSTRRTVFINRDTDMQVSEIRRQAVRETINTFYSQGGPAQVAFSQKRPVTTSGLKGELIQREWLGSMPAPAIPVSVGQTVSASVTN